MPWYRFVRVLPGGRQELLAVLNCRDDTRAADAVSAAMFPGAQVWIAHRHVATLPADADRFDPRADKTMVGRQDPAGTGVPMLIRRGREAP